MRTMTRAGLRAKRKERYGGASGVVYLLARAGMAVNAGLIEGADGKRRMTMAPGAYADAFADAFLIRDRHGSAGRRAAG
jgi:hypothetical protein